VKGQGLTAQEVAQKSKKSACCLGEKSLNVNVGQLVCVASA